MAEVNIDKQLEYVGNLKKDALNYIKEVEDYFNRRDDDILATILYKYHNRADADGSSITGNDYVGDKKAFINFLAAGKEDIQKLIAENNRIFEKYKQQIKELLIASFKYMGQLYTSNQQAIDELETEIKNRKKQLCKINEEVAAAEQELTTFEQQLRSFESEYVNESSRLVQLDAEIKECRDQLNDSSLADKHADIQAKLDSLLAERSPLNDKVMNMFNDREMLKQDIEDKKFHLSILNMNIKDLDISGCEEKVAKAKEGNEKLKTTIEKDREDYAALGFDITSQDIIGPNKSPEAGKNPPPQDNQSQTKATQPKGSSQQQVTNTVQPQPTNLPAPQTSMQRATNLKNKILGGSDEETKELLAAGGYSDILSSLNSYNNRDKKLLIDKIGKQNSTLDVNKLSNVINAISKSGFCSGLNLQNLVYSNGMLKDFSNLSNEDIDSLNKFVTEIENNKEFIDDEQLDFLQNNFVNNIRCNSLKQSLKPKSFKDFFKSKNARERDKIRDAKLGNLCSTISSIPPKKSEAPIKSSDFFNTLTGNTRDNIDINTQTKQTPAKDQQTR